MGVGHAIRVATGQGAEVAIKLKINADVPTELDRAKVRTLVVSGSRSSEIIHESPAESELTWGKG